MSLSKLWWEVYGCGCVSETHPRKRDLLGYCPDHGDGRTELWHGDARKDNRTTTAKKEEPDR